MAAFGLQLVHGAMLDGQTTIHRLNTLVPVDRHAAKDALPVCDAMSGVGCVTWQAKDAGLFPRSREELEALTAEGVRAQREGEGEDWGDACGYQ